MLCLHKKLQSLFEFVPKWNCSTRNITGCLALNLHLRTSRRRIDWRLLEAYPGAARVQWCDPSAPCDSLTVLSKLNSDANIVCVVSIISIYFRNPRYGTDRFLTFFGGMADWNWSMLSLTWDLVWHLLWLTCKGQRGGCTIQSSPTTCCSFHKWLLQRPSRLVSLEAWRVQCLTEWVPKFFGCWIILNSSLVEFHLMFSLGRVAVFLAIPSPCSLERKEDHCCILQRQHLETHTFAAWPSVWLAAFSHSPGELGPWIAASRRSFGCFSAA